MVPRSWATAQGSFPTVSAGKLVKMQIPEQAALRLYMANKLQNDAETLGPGAVTHTELLETKTKR